MAELRRSRPLLGTFVDIQAYHAKKSVLEIASDIDKAFFIMAQIESLMSFHSQSSELTFINANPGNYISVSPYTYHVIRLARTLGKMTNNAFNCTVGGTLVKKNLLPVTVGHAFLAQGSWQDIAIQKRSIKLHRPVLLTLDGIAKGFAVDMASQTLLSQGVGYGLINAGGDMLAFGDQRFHISVRDAVPSKIVTLFDEALASSQVTAVPNERFSSLMVNAATNSKKTVLTVTAKSAWRADALTKVVACAPIARRHEIVNKLGGKIIQ